MAKGSVLETHSFRSQRFSRPR